MSITSAAAVNTSRRTSRRARRALAGLAVTAVIGITTVTAAGPALADPALVSTPDMQCGYNTMTADKLDFNDDIGTLSWIPELERWNPTSGSWVIDTNAPEQTTDTSGTFGGVLGLHDQAFTGLTPGDYYAIVDFTSVNGGAWVGVAAQTVSVTAGVVDYCRAG